MKVYYNLTRVMNYVAMGVLSIMTLLTVTDVFLRYAFRLPILGTTEMTEVMMVTMSFMALAWCAVQRGHLKVDLIMARLPLRIQAIVDSITLLAGLGICSILSWRIIFIGLNAYDKGLGTSLLEIPHYPFYWIISWGYAILCIAIILQIIENAGKAIRGADNV